jgi:diguanylate cyclase (GGDEF)-like protein
MKLPAKTLLLLLFITLLSFGSAIYIQRSAVLPDLIELEAKSDRKDLQRVVIGFDMIRDLINTLTYDYAAEDDLYQYFFHRDEAYLQRNFGIGTFIKNEFSVALLADKDGHIIWSAYADLDEEYFFPQGFYDPNELIPYIANANEARPGAPISISGIVNTSSGIIIFSSYSVLKSDESGDSPGSLFLGRHIDDNVIEEVKDMVKISFTTTPVVEGKTVQLTDRQLSRQQRDTNNTIGWYLFDILDKPILKISLQLEERAFNDHLISEPMLGIFFVMTVSWLIIIYSLNHSLLQPILAIGKHLFHIRSTGDYSARLNSRRSDEVGELSNECDLLIQYIDQQQELVEQQSEELYRLSYEDGLTKLANRRRFDQALSDYWNFANRNQQTISLILCDIDYFKKYNDHYGHQAGDQALVSMAQALLECICRKSDLAARYGGEEFVLILPDTDEVGATHVANKLQQQLKLKAIPHQYSQVSTVLSCSMGIATLIPSDNTDPSLLVNLADQALYQAKEQGRNRFTFYADAAHSIPAQSV